MFRLIARFVLTALLIALWPGYAQAQAVAAPPAGGVLASLPVGHGGTVSGHGTVTLRPVPTALRMHIQVQARASTAEKALARLKDRRQVVGEKLKTLGTDVRTITFGPPSVRKIGSPYSPTFAPAPTYLLPPPPTAPAWRPSGPPPNSSQQAEPSSSGFTASATLSADWPLQSDGLEQVLIAAEALKEKIRAGDLTGIGQPENRSTDEVQAEEVAAEPTGRAERYVPVPTVNGGTAWAHDSVRTYVSPGATQFLFVAEISPQQRKAAMAEAFAKAKAKARELAEAAGMDLGPLAGLAGWAGNANLACCQTHVPPEHFLPLSSSRSVFAAREPPEELKENEVGGPDPRAVEFRCWVAVTFRLL